MRKFVLVLILVPILFAGCGEADTSTGSGDGAANLERQVQRHRAAVKRAKLRQQARAAARRHHRQVAELVAAEEEAASEEESSECDPNYAGACLDPSAYDYDCEGGSGDGPEYTGTVTVVGEDHYGLDADSDGTGCEPY